MSERSGLSHALFEVAQGSQSALGEVYSRTSAKLFGICLRILNDRGEAEDALQDIYINVWRKAGSFDPTKASPISWLAAMARNRSVDRVRARRSPPAESIEAADNVPDEAESALEALERGEEGGRLDRCMGELEGRQALAIRSAFFDGFTYNELAAQSKVPLGTMKSWVRRGLLRLRECLEA